MTNEQIVVLSKSLTAVGFLSEEIERAEHEANLPRRPQDQDVTDWWARRLASLQKQQNNSCDEVRRAFREAK